MNPIAEFETVRMDKVNVALAMFNAQAVAGKKENK